MTSSTPPLRIAVTGASGFLGSALVATLEREGHQVLRLVRRPPRAGEIQWDPLAGTIDRAALDGVDAVAHLAGESIASGRWTAARRQSIRDSRILGTQLLASTLATLPRRPATFVSASAVGVYGNQGDEVLEESHAPGTGFLAEVGRAWERATDAAASAGIRVVLPRLGIILAPHGGALAKMLPPFRLGLGGPLGSGRQWMSWLTLDDAVGIFVAALTRPELSGPINAVAPNPVRNSEFTRALATAVHRPAFFPVPAPVLSALFGEMARETLLVSQRVVPARLEAAGFRFRDPELLPALQRLLTLGR